MTLRMACDEGHKGHVVVYYKFNDLGLWPAGAGSEPFSITVLIENSRFLGCGRQEPDRSNSYCNFIRNALICEPWPAGAGCE